MGNTKCLLITGCQRCSFYPRNTPMRRIASLKPLTTRAAEECQAYIKPGVIVKELEEKAISICGCDPENPCQCTDFNIDCETSDKLI